MAESHAIEQFSVVIINYAKLINVVGLAFHGIEVVGTAERAYLPAVVKELVRILVIVALKIAPRKEGLALRRGNGGEGAGQRLLLAVSTVIGLGIRRQAQGHGQKEEKKFFHLF